MATNPGAIAPGAVSTIAEVFVSSFLQVAALVFFVSAPGEPDHNLRVEVVGRGPDVVLVTGLLGVAEGFRGLAEELAFRGRRAISIEPLGVGHSARPRDAHYSLTAQADRIAAVLDSLGVEKALVAGHAVSAAIAYRLAASRPDLVRGVVALEGGAPAGAGTPSLDSALRFAPLLRLFGARSQVRRIFTRELEQASADPEWVSESVVTTYSRGPLENLGATIHAYRAMSRAREPEPLPVVLGRIECPILLLRGEAGRVPESEVALIRERVRVVTVERVAGAGVFLHEERPAAVAAAMVAFDPIGTNARFSVNERRRY